MKLPHDNDYSKLPKLLKNQEIDRTLYFVPCTNIVVYAYIYDVGSLGCLYSGASNVIWDHYHISVWLANLVCVRESESVIYEPK